MGEKGSLKNLYKSFRFFLRNKKKQKEEEKLEKEKRKTSIKMKQAKLSFFVVLTLIFGFFSTIFSPNKKTKQITEVSKSEDLEKVKKIVVEIEVEIKQAKDLKKINNLEIKLAQIEETLNKATLSEVLTAPVIKQIKQANKLVVEKKDDLFQQKKSITLETKITKINNDLEIDKNKIDLIKEKLDMASTIEEVFDLKKELDKLEEKFKNNVLKEEDIKKLDQFLLLYNTEEIKILKAKIDDKLKKTTLMKTKPINSLPEVNQQEKAEEILPINKNKEVKEKIIEQQQEAKEKKEEKPIESQKELSFFNDIKMMTVFINKQIAADEKKVKEIIKVRTSKPIFFSKLRNLVSHSLRLCASISPFFIFKNKIFGSFTSSILLNNSIRSLRRSISDNSSSIKYIRTNGLELIIKEHDEIKRRTEYVFDDSLTQLILFKSDFIDKYGNHLSSNSELIGMMNEINSIENYILLKKEEYNKENEKIKMKLKRY